METNATVSFLIKKAGLSCGSEYKLAKAMGIPQTTLSGWRAGTRTCTPADRARLAGFAGEDAVQELVRATIDSSKGLKREQLVQLLGKLSHQTGDARATVLLAMFSATCSAGILFDIPRCISCNLEDCTTRLTLSPTRLSTEPHRITPSIDTMRNDHIISAAFENQAYQIKG